MSKYCFAYVASILLLSLLQISIGCDITLLATISFVALTGVVPLSKSKIFVSDIIFFAMVIYFGTAALVIKCLVLQPLQSNLIRPQYSALYLMAGFLSICLAYLVSSIVKLRIKSFARIQYQFLSVEFLKQWSKPVFAMGFALYGTHTAVRAYAQGGGFEEGGFGGFGVFYPILLLGVVMQVALCSSPRGSRGEIKWLMLMAVAALGLSLAGNAKRVMLDFVLVVIVSYFAFRIQLRLWMIAGGILSASLLVLYFQPAIQIVRSQSNLSVFDRVPATWAVLEENKLDPFKISTAADEIAMSYKLSYAQSYIYPVAWNTERYTMILPIDEVVRNLDRMGSMGLTPVWRDVVQNILPSTLITKVPYNFGDELAWHFGFRENGIIARPVTGLIASAAAAGGMLGAVILPGLVAGIAFIVVDAIGGRIVNNPFAVFVVSSNLVVAEQDITLIAGFVRDLPITLAFVAVLLAASRFTRMSGR